MKKLMILLLLLGVILLAGTFTVSERETAVVTSYRHQQQVYPRGIHFAWPGISSVRCIYINERNSILTIPVKFSQPIESEMQVEVLVEWQVTQPIKYLNQLSQLGTLGLNNLLVEEVAKVLAEAKLTDLNQFNQQNSLIHAPVNLASLGIRVDRIKITKLKHLPRLLKTQLYTKPVKLEPQVVSTQVIESAYYKVQMIKAQTEIDEENLYQQLKAQNPKFYAYFRQIELYRNKAESVADIPPLQQLYN
jgi:regulator of protease activity HflC (stomatin/prohibitin superfamily)